MGTLTSSASSKPDIAPTGLAVYAELQWKPAVTIGLEDNALAIVPCE
jgi:hypothetical protein